LDLGKQVMENMMKFMIILMAGKAGNLAKKIGIASICAATALSGFAKDYSAVDVLDSNVASSGLEKVLTVEDNVGNIPFGGKIIKDGKVLYDSGKIIEGDLDYNGNDLELTEVGTPIDSFKDYLIYLNGGVGLDTVETVKSSSDSDYHLKFRDSFGSVSSVSNIWNVGFSKDDEWVGYATNKYYNIAGREGRLYGDYIVPLQVGEKPDDVIFISDTNNDGIGEAFSDESLVLGSDDYLYSSHNILVGGNLDRNDLSQLPINNNTSASAIPPHMMVAPWTTNGMPIAWAMVYGITNNFENTANTDSDGDGHTGLQEFEADTNPVNSSSVFKVNYENGLVKFDSSTECSYSISSSSDLENWTNVFSNIAGNGGEMGFPVSTNAPLKYIKAGVKRVNR
jgi:hypothetical protein